MLLPIIFGRSLTQAAQKTAQVIAAYYNPFFRIIRIVELLPPVIVPNNPTEDALVVSEQNKCHKTACCDGCLKGFAPSIPGTHNEQGIVSLKKVADDPIPYAYAHGSRPSGVRSFISSVNHVHDETRVASAGKTPMVVDAILST